ncbi:MAG: ClpXP protease specificity-enhancing factor SspB [Myxococcota bacterium]|nr:ClpXP protease specificity-enhancing factor SspB [Myxococcota bacterium]
MPSTQPLPPKKEVALALLERSSVYVHLDPRHPAVVVPAGYRKEPQLVLQVGLNMPVPIPDLHLDDDGISCTLSFSREAFLCVVPWASVFAMVGEDGRGMVWPDDVPVEVARKAQVRAVPTVPEKEAAGPAGSGAARDPKLDAPKKRARKRPPLSAVPDTARPARVGAVAATKPVKSAPAERAASPPDAPRPVAAPAPPARPVAGAARKKRQLPPYLRVVK